MTVVKRKGRIAELTFGIESSEIPTKYSSLKLGHPFKIDHFGLFSNLKSFYLENICRFYQQVGSSDLQTRRQETNPRANKNDSLETPYQFLQFTNGTWKHLGVGLNLSRGMCT